MSGLAHSPYHTRTPSLTVAVSYAGYPSILSNSSHAVSRIIIAAKAFGTCGLVLHDDKLVSTSRKLISHALTGFTIQRVFH